MELRGAVVTITGGSSGIGRAAALGFAREDSVVVVAARRPALLDEVVGEIERRGGRAKAAVCDVGDWTDVQRLAMLVESEFGRCDVLVNNAGARLPGRFMDVPIEDIDHVVRTNCLGVVYCTRAFLPALLRAPKGHIVNVSSMAVRVPLPGDPVYAATKHAVTGFSEALGFATRPHGVRVTSIHPGWVATEGFAPPTQAGGRGVNGLSPDRVGEAIVRVVRSDGGPEVFLRRGSAAARLTRTVAPRLYRFAVRRRIRRRMQRPGRSGQLTS